MTHPLAIWYHGLFTSVHRQIDPNYAIALMADQMTTISECGLEDKADEIHIGVNGGEADGHIAKLLAPSKAQIHIHGEGSATEITTMALLREWVTWHPGWNVLYFHMKGVSHPEQPNTSWRLNMEKAVLWDWRKCVLDLDMGSEAVGAYWLTPEEYPTMVQSAFFGGTMWWARSNFLATLPPLPKPDFANRYEAEKWIGSGPRRPRVKNYVTGWPPQFT